MISVEKRIIATVLTLALGFGLFACGFEEDEDFSALIEENEDEDDGLTTIGFSQPGAESAWRVALTESVRGSFSEREGYKLIYKDGKSKQDNQIKDIRTFILQGVDYIILSPIVETGWDAVLEEAKEAGIPVIICDRNVVVSNESLYTAYVGTDFVAEGEKAVAYLKDFVDNRESEKEKQAELFGGEYIRNESLNIVHLQGTLGSSAQLGRSKALLQAVEENPSWNIIAEESGEFTKAKTREIVTEILKEYTPSEIDVIYCENDDETFGAMAALNEAGVSYGPGGDVAIISFDGTRMALEMTFAGQINYEIECNPIQGNYILGIIEKLEAKEKVPKITYIREESFTQDSLTQEFIEKRKY